MDRDDQYLIGADMGVGNDPAIKQIILIDNNSRHHFIDIPDGMVDEDIQRLFNKFLDSIKDHPISIDDNVVCIDSQPMNMARALMDTLGAMSDFRQMDAQYEVQFYDPMIDEPMQDIPDTYEFRKKYNHKHGHSRKNYFKR